MERSSKELCQLYVEARHQNPAWQILAARRGPLVLSCLKPLFEQTTNGIAEHDALQPSSRSPAATNDHQRAAASR